MTLDQVDRTVVTQTADETGRETIRTASRHTSTGGPLGPERTRRIVVLMFGLIQILIGARVVLFMLDARATNGLVSVINAFSGLFVAPFEGILRTNTVTSSGSILDVAALLALVGWTVVELIVIWALATFRREPAYSA
jgi:hypothetical protein